MSDSSEYTHKNLDAVDDIAAKHGFSEIGEVRFATGDLDAEQTGFSHHRLKPNARQGFGHKHDDAEEIYVVIAGSGRVKLDDDVVELTNLDAIRVSPGSLAPSRAATTGWSSSPSGSATRATARSSPTGGRTEPELTTGIAGGSTPRPALGV